MQGYARQVIWMVLHAWLHLMHGMHGRGAPTCFPRDPFAVEHEFLQRDGGEAPHDQSICPCQRHSNENHFKASEYFREGRVASRAKHANTARKYFRLTGVHDNDSRRVKHAWGKKCQERHQEGVCVCVIAGLKAARHRQARLSTMSCIYLESCCQRPNLRATSCVWVAGIHSWLKTRILLMPVWSILYRTLIAWQKLRHDWGCDT